ncbi:MAG: metallophosphoesterase [Oscillospiraceae bacterium]|nr:metallophosphoesterase [Oscillospiraceae bacterium]
MKILVLSDIHYENEPDKRHYPATEIVQPVFWDWLYDAQSQYALIATCGDLVVRGSAGESELWECREKLDALNVPYLAVPGNHDICPIMGMEKNYPGTEEYEYKPLCETNYAKVFGEKGLRNVQYINGIKLIGFALRNADPDGQLDWFEEELKEPVPKLVFNHYPVVPARSGGFCATWDYKRVGDSLERFAELLKNPEHRVAAYFCGHLHINSVMPLGNCLQVVTGPAGLGLTTYREVDIGEDKITVTTKRLPHFPQVVGPLFNATEKDSTDKEHISVYDYHFGNEIEREFEIDLRKYKS